MWIFYLFSFLTIYGAIGTVMKKNLVSCALHLALSMISIAALFFHLGAWFIAAVQIAVYAGAVMVLFVMVIMLFDTTKQEASFSSRHPLFFIKTILCVMMFGLVSGMIPHSTGSLGQLISPNEASIKSLSFILFSKYIFIFEWLGLILLIIAVGVVILSRGTKDDFDH